MTDANVLAVKRGLKLIGRQYKLYGNFTDDPTSKGDCSSLTEYACNPYLPANHQLEHNSGLQAEETALVPNGTTLELADLAFYGQPISHVTMYIGHGHELQALWGIDPAKWGMNPEWRVCLSASYPDAYGPGHGVGISRLMMYSSINWKPIRYGRPYWMNK